MPIQPIVLDEHGVARFRKNAIVRWLLDAGPFDMNDIARHGFSREDAEQFAQLIGYSVGGFSDLSYASDEVVEHANAAVKALHPVASLVETTEPREFRDELRWARMLCRDLHDVLKQHALGNEGEQTAPLKLLEWIEELAASVGSSGGGQGGEAPQIGTVGFYAIVRGHGQKAWLRHFVEAEHLFDAGLIVMGGEREREYVLAPGVPWMQVQTELDRRCCRALDLVVDAPVEGQGGEATAPRTLLGEMREKAERYFDFRTEAPVRTDSEAYATLFSDTPPTYGQVMASILLVLTRNGVAAWDGDGTAILAQAFVKLFGELSTARAALEERTREPSAPPQTVWRCKIGVLGTLDLPDGSDAPMRQAIKRAFHELTGQHATFTFSGWAARLDEKELAVVENREPRTRAEPAEYELLVEAVEQSLTPCIVEDDVAAVAIYEGAIAEAGVAISTADEAFHTIRAAISRDLARKHNAYLATICTLIDGIWEGSVTFGRLHEQRRRGGSGVETPRAPTDEQTDEQHEGKTKKDQQQEPPMTGGPR